MSQETQAPTPDLQDIVARFPLSTTQQRCWFLDQMQPGNPALNVAVRWEVTGDITADIFEAAFQTVIDRHEILRTRFRQVDGTPEQQVVAGVKFKLDVVDLRRIEKAAQPARIEDIAHDFAQRPFDLGQPNLIRAVLVWLTADRALIIFVVHQSCFDGYSIRVLGHEIGTAAQAFAAGAVPDLPDLPLQYGDFTLWQHDYLASGVLEEESAYWLQTLDNLSYFEVPPDKARPQVKSTDVDLVMRDLAADFGPKLDQTAQRLGVSPFTFGAAIFSACLGRMTGAQDVLFGTQIAGRLDTDLDTLIGVFINNLVLRFQANPAISIAEHVTASKAVVEGALTHQTMPFNVLVERLNPVRDPSRTPLISVNFNLQNVFMETKSYGGFELRSSPSHAPGAIYDLDLAVMGRPTGWQLNLEYAVTLFETQTAEAILDLVAAAFDFAFDNITAPLADIPVPQSLATRGDADRTAIIAAEQLLVSHAMVQEAAVVQSGDGLYGFIVPGDTGTWPLEQLPQRIMDHIGEASDTHLAGVSLIGAFPRTVTGDVNKSLLTVPAKRSTSGPVMARADIVTALKDDWSEILGIMTVPSDAHFFDLGGHSVLVLRQLARIRDRWGIALDVTAIYENAVLSDLARLVTAQLETPTSTPKKDWRYMTLATKGNSQPLIAINNAATGLALATAGQNPRPVNCARVSDGDRGLIIADQTFEQIAAAYADVIKAGQPKGPYMLYGNCVHGNLALETARILQTGGATIAGVVMKDVWEPGYTSRILQDPEMRRAEKWFSLRTRLRAVWAGEMSLGTLLRFYSIAHKTGVVALGTKLGLLDRVHKTDLDQDQEGFISAVSQKRDAYLPDAITFPVLHIVTDITPTGDGFAPSIGWEDVVIDGCLKTVHLDKVTVLRDKRTGVDNLAAEIEEFLGEI